MTVHLTSKDYVQSIDSASNLEERDVIGNKSDTVSGTSVVSRAKQIQGYHDVPAQNSVDNVRMRDVIGNKTDTGAGTSLYAKLSQVQSMNPGPLERLTAALPQTNQSALFTVNGVIQILEIRGEVTTQVGAVANATKLVSNPTVGADVDLCATNDITGDVVGTMYSITGTFANPMIATTSGAFESQANPITVAAGTIDINCAGNDGGGGRVKWTVFYRPLSIGAFIVPA